jgi:hypothetical protein
MRPTIPALTMAALAILPGCGRARTDLAAAGALRISGPAASPDASPDPTPDAFEEGGRLVVAGRLFPRGGAWPAAVEVTVAGPDGAVLHRVTVPTTRAADPSTSDRRGLPRGPRAAASPAASYRAEFPAVPPKGSAVTVRRAEGSRGG